MDRKSHGGNPKNRVRSLVSSMVSEQIRKTEENGDEDAVEMQDSYSSVDRDENDATVSDNKEVENASNGNHKESKVSEGKTLVGSAAVSMTRMPAIPPPPPPSRPRSELGHKPLPVNPKKTAPPPPLPSSKTPETPAATTVEAAEGSVWATDSQEVSTLKVEDLEQQRTAIESEKPSVEESVDEPKGSNLESAPGTVASSELPSDEKGDETGEMTAVAEPSSPASKLTDSTASEITRVSEEEIDDDGPGAILKSKDKSPGDSNEDEEASEAKTALDGPREDEAEPSTDEKPSIDETKPEAKDDLHSSKTEEKLATDLEPNIDEPEAKKESDHSIEESENSPVIPAAEESENDDDDEVPQSELSLELRSIDFLLTESITEPAMNSSSTVDELNKTVEQETSAKESPEVTSLMTDGKSTDSLESDLKDLFPAELDPLFPDDFGYNEALSSQDTKAETAKTKVEQTDASMSSDDSLPVVSESESGAKQPERRSLSSLVAKGKAEKQTYNLPRPLDSASEADLVAERQTASGGKLQSIFSKIDLDASTESSALETRAESTQAAFEVGPKPKSEGRSKFASLLSSSLGETVSMRDLMENDTIPEVPAPVTDLASPQSIVAESAELAPTAVEVSNSPEVSAAPPEIPSTLVPDPVQLEPSEPEAVETPKVEPPAPEPSPLGADGLPEPWLNLGKKTSESLQAPNVEEQSSADKHPSSGTTSSTGTYNIKGPKSTSNDLHWVSTSDNLNKITEQDLANWVPNADSTEPITLADELKAADKNIDGTNPGTAISTTNSPSLGALQRTTSEGWTPAIQERSSTNWDIVPPSDLESASAVTSSTGQDFTKVIKDEFGHDDFIPDHQVTSETAEAVFLKGDVTEAARQYHVLIEREENSATPNIIQIIQWSESLADLYILMDEPASAVSFYYKARKLAPEPEPRRIQKYLSCLLKLSTRYEEDGNRQEAEKTYLEAIKVAGEELDEKDVLHQRINEAYVRHSKQKSESSSSSHTAAIEEQCSTLRMRAVKGTDKAFSPTRKPTAKEIFEETKLEKADKAERNEKIRRASGTDIEFKAARGLEELSGHPMMRVLNSIWVQVILGVMLIMCGLTCMISLRMTESIAPIPVSVDLKGTYKTAEELKVVEFKAHNKVGIWDEGAVATGTFKAVRGTTDDLLELLRGHMRSKTVFYTLDNDLMQDEEGRALYRPDAPERKIIKQMWWYTGFATWHYKEKHCYQTTTQPWNRVNPKFTYVNPFTGKPTFATITATQGAGNKLLPLVVASGQMYEGEPAPGPGAIRCICFDKVRFFVRGFDRNGKMIQGREPGKAYVIELTDGQNMTEKYMASINVKDKPGQGKVPLRVIVVTDNKELPSMYKSWTTVAPACIIAFLFLSVAITVIALLRKKDKLKWYHYLSTSAAVAIAIGWFAIALQS